MFKKLFSGDFVRTVSYLKPRKWPYLIGMLVFSISFTIMPLLESVIIKYVIEAAVQKQISILLTGIIIVITTALTVVLLVPAFRYMYTSRSNMTTAEIRVSVYDHLLKLPIGYFEDNHSGSIVSRLTYDLSMMGYLFTSQLRRLLFPFIYGLSAAIPMFLLEWRISIVLVLLNFLSSFVNTRFSKPLRKLSDKIHKSNAVMTERLIDMLAGFNEAKLFHINRIITGRYLENNKEITKLYIQRTRMNALLNSANYLLGMINTLGVLVAGSFIVSKGYASFAVIFALMSLQGNLNRAFLEVGIFLPRVQSMLAAASRVYELLDSPPEPEYYDVEGIRNSKAVVEMRNVVFGYEGERKALNNLSFTAEKGQTIGFVGPSGGGKTTVAKIIMGYYPPESGSIAIHGKPMGEYSLSKLRDMMSYVSQNSYLFNGTIEENIRYGKPDATEEEIINAAKASYAHDFIMQQPEGYNTIVGERGIKLSGGQKQRLAIARAIIKDAPILILDEATSSLDSESEEQVQKAFEALAQNKTAIVIAHRLSTVEHADIIYVIDDGKVAEQGNHVELLALDGLYSMLYNIQFEKEEEDICFSNIS